MSGVILKDVKKRYGNVDVIHGIDLEIAIDPAKAFLFDHAGVRIR